MLLPLENSTLRRSLNQWFNRHNIKPRVVAEFEDSALLKVFGADGIGLFVAPTVVEDEVIAQYGVQVLGRAPRCESAFTRYRSSAGSRTPRSSRSRTLRATRSSPKL